MLIDKQFEKVLGKIRNMVGTYNEYIFERVGQVNMAMLETRRHLRKPPELSGCSPVAPGTVWGGEHITGWFRGSAAIDDALAGRRLFVTAQTGAPETLFFVNGVPKGLFAPGGNHRTLQLTPGSPAGEVFDIALEAYCGHNIAGVMPFQQPETMDRKARFGGVFIEAMRDEVKDFVIELKILSQLADNVTDNYRRARIQNALFEVFKLVPQRPDEYDEAYWSARIAEARAVMKPLLEAKNTDTAPYAGLIGHSHMDTAWLWTIDETIRKCARTYSNVLSLMSQYPEYKFFQSSTYHSELMRREYPAIFEEMKKRVAEGRYEPNGGVWVECDCNLVSGESLIRQFLWGQRWSKKYFNYQSDTFWLPDTFGYSAALPQIMRGCKIKNFLTTKLSWNDTNEFPYDTFYWRGMDGSVVLTHFNATHCYPDAQTLISVVSGSVHPKHQHGSVKFKRVNDCRLISYGYGDGGGGPTYDMVETAMRLKDVEGCPKSSHTTVSRFMDHLRETAKDIPLYSGELYFEMHRGTLTSQHQIKRNNRKAEIALHDLDFAASAAFINHKPVPSTAPFYETLLVNQFHDILPGTCIPPVNERCIREVGEVIRNAKAAFDDCMFEKTAESDQITLFNTLSWERKWALIPDYGKRPQGSLSQSFTDLRGEKMLYIENISLPAYAGRSFNSEPAGDSGASPFRYDGTRLETPCLSVAFDNCGRIASMIDKASGRELRREGGYPLNTFLFGEEIPAVYDNWDLDIDAFYKLEPVTSLQKREVVAEGPLQLRIRSVYALGRASTITQDMVFYANTPRVDFETLVDWNETHKLLKAAFNLNVTADEARHEIQFGYATRPTYKRNTFEQAMFEVLNHKYTDLSETRFGVAILNDCKYGIALDGTQAALSLIKSGTHPDPGANKGVHFMVYSLLPHGAFSAENVVRPAYELNVPVRSGAAPALFLDKSLITVSAPNVIAETIKVAEDGDGIVIRLYECEKCGCDTELRLNFAHSKIYETNMLEEPVRELPAGEALKLSFRAFEIKTIKVLL